ncbi:MAG: hypothetical protein JNJ83_18310 [Verrucomicrobiaceae bacterium]|nr:hypothetical protein [Verrucomicrobiaceae bacterium]
MNTRLSLCLAFLASSLLSSCSTASVQSRREAHFSPARDASVCLLTSSSLQSLYGAPAIETGDTGVSRTQMVEDALIRKGFTTTSVPFSADYGLSLSLKPGEGIYKLEGALYQMESGSPGSLCWKGSSAIAGKPETRMAAEIALLKALMQRFPN